MESVALDSTAQVEFSLALEIREGGSEGERRQTVVPRGEGHPLREAGKVPHGCRETLLMRETPSDPLGQPWEERGGRSQWVWWAGSMGVVGMYLSCSGVPSQTSRPPAPEPPSPP